MCRQHEHMYNIIDLIGTAFSDILYPGDERIVNGSDLESMEIAAFFKGRHWRELRVAQLSNAQCESLYFMSPAAYQYYLPGYMIVSLRDYENADVVPFYVFRSLMPEYDIQYSGRSSHLNQDMFSSKQRYAIVQFLRSLELLERQHGRDYLLSDFATAVRFWGEDEGTENGTGSGTENGTGSIT